MTIDLDFIDRLAALVARGGLREIDYREGERRIRIVAGGGDAPSIPAAPARPSPGAPAQAEGRHVVVAGMVGVFYRAPAPGSPPFVGVGDRVTEGQTLAILEAMKLFNPVEADRDGIVADILVEDGAAVAPGTPLIVLGPVDGG